MEILEARSRIEREIYDLLKIIKYKIDNSEFNLKLLKERVKFIMETHL